MNYSVENGAAGFSREGLTHCTDSLGIIDRDIWNIWRWQGATSMNQDDAILNQQGKWSQRPGLNHVYCSSYVTGVYNNTGVHNNTGVYNTDVYNIGVYNTGLYNTGLYNTGLYNTGL